MFDWDEDYEELVHTRPEQNSATRTPSRNRFGLIALAALLVIGAGYFGQSTLRTALMSTEISDMVALDLLEALSPQLQALDLVQAQSFLSGLRDFTDPQLLDYAGHAHRDHAAATHFMQPYLADAVVLIAQELTRRGF